MEEIRRRDEEAEWDEEGVLEEGRRAAVAMAGYRTVWGTSPRRGVYGRTERACGRVMPLLMKGLTYEAIGRRLGMSRERARYVARVLMERYGVRSRGELVGEATKRRSDGATKWKTG